MGAQKRQGDGDYQKRRASLQPGEEKARRGNPGRRTVGKGGCPEYRTTSEEWNEAYSEKCCGEWIDYRLDVPDPIPPEEEGNWSMCGSTATRTRVFWFWKKEN